MTLEDAHVAARLPAHDLDRAREWYADKLGLEPAEERPGGLRYVLHGMEFAIFQSAGQSDGRFTQLAFTVTDVRAQVADLAARGVVFEDYDFPGMRTADHLAEIEGNYPSKGTGELASWFRDSEGNMIGMAQTITA